MDIALVSKKNIQKKSLVIGGMLGSLIFGVYFFWMYQNLFQYFQPYYLKSYSASFRHGITRLDTSFLSLRNIFTNGQEVYYAGAEGTGAKDVPVLLYHGILKESDGVNVDIDTFQDQMFALKEAGWNTITITDFYKFKRGEISLPEKSFLLTFDDGRKDSYYPADPILQALDYNAVMFVITRVSLAYDSNYYLTLRELHNMANSGRWELQSHGRDDHAAYIVDENGTKGHFLSNKLWLEDENRLETEQEFTSRIVKDLVDSKNELEREFSTQMISFAYPFGDYGQETLNFPGAEKIVKEQVETIYPMALYQVGVRFTSNFQDPDALRGPYQVKRIDVRAEWDAQDLLYRIETGSTKKLPYHDTLATDNGWIAAWGGVDLAPNKLTLAGSPDRTGEAAILNGTYLWEDYQVNARVEWVSGNNIYIWARYKNDQNYVACNFGRNKMHIEQVLNGDKRVIKGEDKPLVTPAGDFEISMKVEGRTVQCFVDGRLTLETQFLDPSLTRGGIGFKSWDPYINTSRLFVKEITATPLGETTSQVHYSYSE